MEPEMPTSPTIVEFITSLPDTFDWRIDYHETYTYRPKTTVPTEVDSTVNLLRPAAFDDFIHLGTLEVEENEDMVKVVIGFTPNPDITLGDLGPIFKTLSDQDIEIYFPA